MENNERIAKKLESGPLRRLEVLSRWMSAMGVDTALCRLLEESLEDLRDVLLHLKASHQTLTPASEYRVAAWQELPEPPHAKASSSGASDKKSSLATVEMEGRAATPVRGTISVSSTTTVPAEPGNEALPPSLITDHLDVPLAHVGRAINTPNPIRVPTLRKPLDEHRGKIARGKSKIDALREALRDAKIDQAQAQARAHAHTDNSSTRLLDAELDFLIEHTVSRLLAS